MRFSTKVDTWLAVCLGVGMLASLVTPVMVLGYSLLAQHQMPWILLLPVVIWTLVLSATVPQYYELRPDGLFIRHGWHQSLIDYRTLQSARAEDSALSAAVYSTQRVRIEAGGKGTFLIAPQDRPLFLSELAKRTAHLSYS